MAVVMGGTTEVCLMLKPSVSRASNRPAAVGVTSPASTVASSPAGMHMGGTVLAVPLARCTLWRGTARVRPVSRSCPWRGENFGLGGVAVMSSAVGVRRSPLVRLARVGHRGKRH